MQAIEAVARTTSEWLRARMPQGSDLRIDSRAVRPGDAFVALRGRHDDGAHYLQAAIDQGAQALLVEAGMPAVAGKVPLLRIAGLPGALGWIAADFYGGPSGRLRTIGVTGTNGKTSSCQWIAQTLSAVDERCAMLGTLGFGFPGELSSDESNLTTPDAASVHRLARQALEQGARALAMEVSSIGLDQGRVNGVRFDVALFTNLTRDHLDYHADMNAYAAAKGRLFEWPTLRYSVINLDDPYGHELAQRLADQGRAVIGYTLSGEKGPGARLAYRLRADTIELRSGGLRFRLICDSGEKRSTESVQAPVIGAFNVANLLGVLGVAIACGVPLRRAADAMTRVEAPAGRLQRVSTGPQASEPLAIVDYAHTPDAIAKALEALRPLAQERGGRLWVLFGAGGDRDPGKRPAMARAASVADRIVLTSDNPRSEDPESIIEQIASGIAAGHNYLREPDRARAIRRVIDEADPRDVVLLAGKGHEAYQEIGGRRLPFSDAGAALEALRARAGRCA
jgi:UDP-N-acetylmuramoyl-L-alanyl-D-glutamate--2,6-diaminopimelate ligase